MRILLLAGGWSNEREVSLFGAKAIESALAELGHEVIPHDLSLGFDALCAKAAEADFCFINLHGAPGEDGLPQAILESVGCPYQGSGPTASLLAVNKAAAKALLARRGMPMPRGMTFPGVELLPARIPFKGPYVVKPVLGGSSLGMLITDDDIEALTHGAKLIREGQAVLIEERVDGQEVTAAVLDGQALPLVAISPNPGYAFFDYEAKYTPGATSEVCPAPLEEGLTRRIKELALLAHEALGLHGASRSDFIVTSLGEPMFLEVNTLPGMTGTSLLPQAAAQAGLPFAKLVERLIESGLARHGRFNG